MSRTAWACALGAILLWALFATLVRLAVTFARLGCPYQQARTARLAAGSPTKLRAG